MGAEHAPLDPMQLVPAENGEGQPAAAADAAVPSAEPAAEPERKRRHKWGPPAAGEFASEEQKPRKRRSRWETSTDIIVPTSKGGQIIIPGQLPKEVTICGGMKVGRQGCGGLYAGAGAGAHEPRQRSKGTLALHTVRQHRCHSCSPGPLVHTTHSCVVAVAC